MLLALLLLLLPSVAFAQWTNEPAGSVQVLDCNFSSTPGACGILDTYSSSFQDSDASATVSPSGVRRSTIFQGNTSGGMQLDWYNSSQTNEMFLGLMWRTNPAFRGRPQNDKMFFMRGPGSNGYFGLYTCPGSSTRQIGWGGQRRLFRARQQACVRRFGALVLPERRIKPGYHRGMDED